MLSLLFAQFLALLAQESAPPANAPFAIVLAGTPTEEWRNADDLEAFAKNAGCTKVTHDGLTFWIDPKIDVGREVEAYTALLSLTRAKPGALRDLLSVSPNEWEALKMNARLRPHFADLAVLREPGHALGLSLRLNAFTTFEGESFNFGEPLSEPITNQGTPELKAHIGNVPFPYANEVSHDFRAITVFVSTPDEIGSIPGVRLATYRIRFTDRASYAARILSAYSDWRQAKISEYEVLADQVLAELAKAAGLDHQVLEQIERGDPIPFDLMPANVRRTVLGTMEARGISASEAAQTTANMQFRLSLSLVLQYTDPQRGGLLIPFNFR
jgi:hypothetical protein